MRTWIGTLIAGAIAIGFGGLAGPRLHAEDRPASSIASTTAHSAIVYDAAVTGDASETRLVFDMTADAEVKAYVMAVPNRLVVDMPEVGFALTPGTHGRGAGLVSAYRYGVLRPGRSRIVADLSGPAEVVSQDWETTEIGRRLTLVLRKSERDIVLTRTSAPVFPPFPPVQPAKLSKGDRAESPIGLPRRVTEAREPIVIAIDPGHGGIDSGATSQSGLLEKSIVLAFGQALAEALNDDPGFKAVLTREDDLFLPLAERVAFAQAAGAQLFISIHADAVKERYVRGATVYTLSERASDARAAALADKENRVDLLAGLSIADDDQDVADILFDLARRETKNFSIIAARTLVSEIKGATRLNKNPIRSARFKVLRAPDIPSVLLELGYLSNAEDAKSFESDAWREKTVARMKDAIARYFGRQGLVAGAAELRR